MKTRGATARNEAGAALVRSHLAAAGFENQGQIAAHFDVGQSTVSAWEARGRKYPLAMLLYLHLLAVCKLPKGFEAERQVIIDNYRKAYPEPGRPWLKEARQRSRDSRAKR